MKSRIPLIIRCARPAEILVGLVFIAGALLKVFVSDGINNFSVQIYAYGVIQDKSLLPPAALCTLAIEMFLGWALLTRLRLRMLTFVLLEGMLVVFTALILYGWFFHELEDCGCFGPLEMSPARSVAKNIVLFALGALAWAGAALKASPTPPAPARLPWIRAATALLLSAALTGYAFADLNDVIDMKSGGTDEEPGQPGPFTRFVFDTDQGAFDLGKGEHVVIMLSMDCEHCMEEMPSVNELVLLPGVPRAVALCYVESPGDMEQFRLQTDPQFALHPLEQPLTYFTLIGDDNLRIYLIRDGRPVQFWDGHAPTYEELMSAVEGQESTPPAPIPPG